jgi:hypothetical protein
MNEDKQTCPFCMTDICNLATVCSSCGAVKGHRLRDGMRSPTQIRAYALLLLGCSIFGLFLAYLGANSASLSPWIGAFVALSFAGLGLGLFAYAGSKPRWYRQN